MNDNHIEIKERRNGLLTKGVLFLVFSLLSLIIALLPYLIKSLAANGLAFYLSGGIAFALFATMFVFLLIKECKPDNAILLNSHGFTDKNNIGDNIEIEWTNVSSVKLMGKKEMPYLGITLENADLVMVHMKKSFVSEMRENIEEGLPHILISQKEIRFPINELKDLFVKFTREARALKNDAPLKPKNNPFTTEDVLRAFGKLDDTAAKAPIEESDEEPDNTSSLSDEKEEQDEETIAPSIDIIEQKATDDTTESTQEADCTAQPESISRKPNEGEAESIDSFYEMLIRQAESVKSCEATKIDQAEASNNEADTSSPSEQNSENQHSSDESDVLADEINELLSKTRSSKIAEIEKMLSEKDVPYSSVRKDSLPSNQDEVYSTLVKDDIKAEDDFITVPEEAEEQKDKNLKNESAKTNSMGDTKEFYPEIIHFDDM